MIDLSAWRKANNHTQASLAVALGVSRLSVIRWENGHTPQPKDLAERLVALVARTAPVNVEPDVVCFKTHGQLYNRWRGRNCYGALHPFNVLKGNESLLDAHRLRPGDESSPLLATVLDTPEYLAGALLVKAKLAALPRITTLSDRRFKWPCLTVI